MHFLLWDDDLIVFNIQISQLNSRQTCDQTSKWLLVLVSANYSSVNIVMWVNEELWVTNCYLWCCNTQWWPLSTHQPRSQLSAQVREVGWAAEMGPTDYRAERLRDLLGASSSIKYCLFWASGSQASITFPHASGLEVKLRSIRHSGARVMCQQCQQCRPHTGPGRMTVMTHVASDHSHHHFVTTGENTFPMVC